MMRRPILAANWKMHKTAGEAAAFASAFLPLVKGARDVDIAIAPPFTALDRLGQALAGSNVALAAQNTNAEEKGAFTGEIAPGMLVDLGCRYAIVGHSERRTLYGETDAIVAAKAAALFAVDITPIVCCGESDAEREAGRTMDVVGSQLDCSLATTALTPSMSTKPATGSASPTSPRTTAASATCAFLGDSMSSMPWGSRQLRLASDDHHRAVGYRSSG